MSTLYQQHRKGLGLSRSTLKREHYFIQRFIRWLDERDLRDIRREDLENYLEYLRNYISEKQKPLSLKSIETELVTLRGFFLFLYHNEYLLVNPAEDLPVNLKAEKKLRPMFAEEEINRFLDSISIQNAAALRDRALFELLYSSALRVSEALKLEVEHIDLEDRTCLLKEAKGRKDRYVPFSKTALKFLFFYLKKGRRKLLKRAGSEGKKFLFSGTRGPLSQKTIRARFKHYLEDCTLEDKGYTLHSIRHASATHLLEHGASIRYVQELLGHTDLKTTQLYTRPGEENIKAVYRTYHPRENEYLEEADEEYLKDVLKLKQDLLEAKAYEKERKQKGN